MNSAHNPVTRDWYPYDNTVVEDYLQLLDDNFKDQVYVFGINFVNEYFKMDLRDLNDARSTLIDDKRLFEQKILYLPTRNPCNGHWTLITAAVENRLISYYDCTRRFDSTIIAMALLFLMDLEHGHRTRGRGADSLQWTVRNADSPVLEDRDTGPWILEIARKKMLKQLLHFPSYDMQSIRNRQRFELHSGRLLFDSTNDRSVSQPSKNKERMRKHGGKLCRSG